MDSDEGVHNAGVQLKIASFFYSDLQSKLLLERLLEFFFEGEHHGDVLEDLSWGLHAFAAV